MVRDRYTAKYGQGREGPAFREDTDILDEEGIEYTVKEADEIEHDSITRGVALVFPTVKDAKAAAEYIIVVDQDKGERVPGEAKLKFWVPGA